MWQEMLQGGGGKTLENITLGTQFIVDGNLPVTVGKYYIIHAFYDGTNDIPTPTGCQVLAQSSLASYQNTHHCGRILFVKATATTIYIKDRFISASEINL